MRSLGPAVVESALSASLDLRRTCIEFASLCKQGRQRQPHEASLASFSHFLPSPLPYTSLYSTVLYNTLPLNSRRRGTLESAKERGVS